jgi:hypothetical protein
LGSAQSSLWSAQEAMHVSSRVWFVTNIVLDGDRLLRKNIIVCATDDVMKLRIVIGDVAKNTSCAKFALKQHDSRTNSSRRIVPPREQYHSNQ